MMYFVSNPFTCVFFSQIHNISGFSTLLSFWNCSNNDGFVTPMLNCYCEHVNRKYWSALQMATSQNNVFPNIPSSGNQKNSGTNKNWPHAIHCKLRRSRLIFDFPTITIAPLPFHFCSCYSRSREGRFYAATIF